MDQNKISDINKLNFEFYKKHAEEFSKTRQNPWQGWDKCLQILVKNNKKTHLNVLDIACGNGRFYQYLTENLDRSIGYLGVDNNDYMLVEALLKYKLPEFRSLDALNNLNEVENQYDLITVFGLTHHIPGKEFRMSWFKQLPNLLNNNGILIVTFWNLSEDDRFKKAQKSEDLEEDDYFYGWGDSKDKRYVHIYSEDEINHIKEMFAQQNLKLVDEFYSDGKTENLNRYLIFQRGL